MKQIRTTVDLEQIAGEFVAFRSTDPKFEMERCLCVNNHSFARISQRRYEYKGELAYKFSILRKDKKWTEYCYLTDSILAQTHLKVRSATEEEKEALEGVTPVRIDKFAAGECFSDGCKLDESPETEMPPQKKYHSTDSAILGLDKLDDNIMFWSVILYLVYKFKNWLFKKPIAESSYFSFEQRDLFQKKIQDMLESLDATEEKLKKVFETSSPEMQWAFEGLKNYRADLKIHEKKFESGLIKKKFDKNIGNILYFIEEVQKELSLYNRSSLASEPRPFRTRSLW